MFIPIKEKILVFQKHIVVLNCILFKCLGNICYNHCPTNYLNQTLEYKIDLFKNYYYTINCLSIEKDDNIYYCLEPKPLAYSE